MFKPKHTVPAFFVHTLWPTTKRVFVVSVLSLLLLPLFFLTRGGTGVPHAYAATSDNLNFQARLETTAGAIAPDGYYNIQFKLYDADSGGTLLWTETYYDSNGGTAGNDNRVRVANGYVTVNLGSQTTFPSNMPWDQQLYLTMNVGGTTQTATPTWDGEMSPRLKLTAVPYAFNAKTASQIVSSSGANLGTLSIAAPTSGNQTFAIQDQGAAGTYNILTAPSGSDGYVKLQTGTPGTQQTGNLNINGAGLFGGLLQAGTLAIGSSQQFTVDASGNVATPGTIAGGSSLTLGVASTANGTIVFQNDTNANTLTVLSGAQTGNYTATVPVLTANDTFCMQGLSNCSADPANFIQNQNTSAQATADFWIDGTGQASSFIAGVNNTSNGTIVFNTTGTTNTVTLASVSQTTGSYTLSIPLLSANADICTSLSNCSLSAGSNYYIQNQNSTDQSADFRINGTGQANVLSATTSVQTPLVDTATATALNIGTTNATSINLNQDTVLASGQTITITGGNTASRPASPTEGMVYYDTTTKQLLTYANGKWQADRSEAVLVAASDSSDGDKASADYVADGNTAAAGDGDQVEVNQALTAATGKKVVLLKGTYTIDASVSIPNNTTLSGIGQGTLITIPNSLNASLALVTNADTTTGTNVMTRDFKVDGNRANQSSGTTFGVSFENVGGGSGSSARTGAKVVNIEVTNTSSNAIDIYYSPFSIISNSIVRANNVGLAVEGSQGTIISGLRSQGNDTSGAWLYTSPNSTVTNSVFEANAVSGVFVSVSSDGSTLTSNTFYANNAGIAVSSSHNVISNNTIEQSNYGIELNIGASNNQISGNTLTDSGGLTNNNAVLDYGSANSITDNTITDSSCSTTCIALNLSGSGANLSANIFTGDGTYAATINDAGTDTVYAGQAMTQGGLDIRFKQANSTTAFNIQNANGVSVMNVDTTNGELEVGTYNGGTNPVAGKIVLATTANANTVTLSSATQTTGSFTLSIPDLTANADVCTSLNNCGSLTSTSGIQNQNASAQTANFWISGTGRADTSILTPTLDTATATALNIGTTNATSINLNQDTTVASGKNLTVTSGTTSLTGTTNINTSGSATTTIGNASATNAIAGTTSVLGTTDINTTGTAATSIGSATGGAVSIAANAASSFTTNTGALTLTSAAAATWGTNAGALTLQGAGGTTVTSTAGATSGDTTISTGNASAGASGNIAIDTGTATTTAGTVSIGTTNASGVTIGRAATTTTIQGTLSITPQASSSTTLLCTNGGVLSTCDASVIAPTATNFIQNQNAIQQTTANFWISGTGRADTSLLTPLLDTATAVALNIGTTNASSINLNQDTVLAAGQSITITGGNTASRPASPTEGMVYYDTTTKQLLTYANGKWQADRSEAILVAASDSSDADKAAADYIADGDTGAAGDGDQVQINDALTAASASGTRKTGKVYLFAGTYTADATILIPNGVTFAGSGQASTIKLADIDATDNLIENSDTTTGTNITIRDLRLEGQRTLNTAGTQIGIYLLGMGKETNGNDAVNGAFISNITSYYFRTDGIRIDSSSHTTVTSSIFRDNAQYGLYILGVNSKFNSVTANQSEGNNVDGFRLEQGYSNTFSGNVAYDNASAGMAIASSANSNNIVNNNFRGNDTYGIYMGASSLNNVSSNNIRGGSTYGIYISGSDGSTINDNNIYDTGSTTANNAIYLTDSDRNSINGNVVDDTSASTNNYAINISNSTSNSNYIAGNILGDNGSGVTATINDAATDTVYGGQATGLDSTNIIFKQAASATAFQIQSGSTNYFTADTSGNKIQIGSATTDATAILFGLDSYNNGTDPTGYNGAMYYNTNTNKFRCYENGAWANCTASAANVIQNQNAIQQTTANFWISGTGRADTSILTPTLDTATAVALSIGTTNATSINLNQDTVLASGQTITIAGDTRANIDLIGTPPEGMTTYDTTNKQLLTYSNGKWQADRSEAILVAASNSSDADKAAADYVGDGNTGAANDGDQVQINQALTAGAGKKVVLLAGTYTIDASISIPNNTTLSGIGQGTLITIPNALNTNFSAIVNTDTTTGTNVTLRDLKLDGNNANQSMGVGTGMAGVDFNNMGGGTGSSARQGARVTNVTSNNWDGIFGSNCQAGYGICLRSSSNNVLAGNTAQANAYYSFALISSSSNNTLTSNTAQGSLTDGFFVSSSNNNTLTGNTAQGNNGIGINISSSNNNTLTGNTAQGNTSYGILATSSSNNTISGNTSQGNTSYGIYITTSSSSNTVSSNTIQGNTSYGIYVSSSSTNNTLTGNSVKGNSAGIVIVSNANTVSGNTLADNGGSTANNGIYIGTSANNTIIGNTITDTSCTTTCYAINLLFAGATSNYLSGNTFTGDGTYAATINDAGTNTIYAGQSMTQGGLDIRFKQANSTTAFNIQNANGVSVMNVDTTNGELEVGTYNGGTNPVAGKIVIATTANANTVTIASATQTGAYTLTIPALAGNATICTDNSTTACNNFIQNQTGTTQTAGFKINGAGTLGGLLTATAGATVSGAVINLNVSSNFAVNVGTGTTTAAVSIGNSANTTNLASRTINIGTVGATNVIQGVAQTTSNTTGDQLTIKGSAGLGSGNGGTLLLSGGDAGASGKMGLVSLNPTAFASSAVQSYGTGGVNNLTAGYVDTYSTIPATATISGVIMSIPDPVLNTTVGRILYVSATTTSQDFTLRLNASRTAIDINLKKNNTATLIWNGTDWTAAGASSATDLQAAYNNTQTNAGGAEIVLNSANQGAGVTIRNSGTPITGALFEVQSSIAANLFSVNNNTTEYASNGGIESGTTDWAGISTSPTQNSTLANVASGLYSLSVPITANNQGVKNTLVSTLSASTTYVVSFAVKTSAAGPYTFNTYYSVDGTANSVNCNNTLPGSGYTLTNNFSVTSNWTKISCFITTPASGMTASNAIRIYETNMGGSGTFYVDNLSVISNAAGTTPANVQIGGGATGGQPTLFTLDQFAGPPMTTDNPAYYGSMYYDTTKNAIQCYQQSSGVGTWGACGSAPDDIISMTPEYTGAVLNGTGVGTMTADFCANQTSVLTVGTLCASGEARNYYKWTSPQATPQTYGIYVTYRLPSTFKSFKSGTMSLTGLVDSTSNAAVKYAVFRKASAGTIYQCSADTTNIGTANTWTSISPTTDITSSSCAAGGANPFAAGDTMIIRITVSAQSNANAYVENLTFQYSNK